MIHPQAPLWRLRVRDLARGPYSLSTLFVPLLLRGRAQHRFDAGSSWSRAAPCVPNGTRRSGEPPLEQLVRQHGGAVSEREQHSARKCRKASTLVVAGY